MATYLPLKTLKVLADMIASIAHTKDFKSLQRL